MPRLKLKKQEEFCRNYAKLKNQTKAYAKAYGKEKEYNMGGVKRAQISVQASRLGTKEHITNRIDEILARNGLNDDTVSQEHYKCLMQDEPGIKLKSVKLYHELKGNLRPENQVNIQNNTIDAELIGELLSLTKSLAKEE